MPTVLLIDDETSIQHAFRRAFRDPEYTILSAGTGREGLEMAAQRNPDVVILDLNLPDQTGLQVFEQIHQRDARLPVIFITGHGTTDTAIEAMKRGACDYLLKPLELTQIRELVNRAVEIRRLMRVPAFLEEDTPAEDGDILVGRCPAMQELYKAIGRIAPQDVTVLIQGESGSGKELVARAIYHHSRRNNKPFLALNCVAIPETLLESELFGHEKGAFTGAERKRIGKFEQCSGGTLFLDEIGDMTPLAQTKLLRLLQDQRFERVGGNETIQADVRLIAATHRNLEELVAQGQFRGDLYYRLSTVTLRLPGLRERPGDLPLLVEHFVKQFSRLFGKDVRTVSPEAIALLTDYPWPGNIRELQSVVKQALLQATGPVLLPEFLPPLIRDKKPPEIAGGPSLPNWDRFVESRLQAGTEDLYAEVLALMERQLLTRVLRHTGGNQLQAARILGITRGSLRTKLRALGIAIERTIESDE